jgi:hypothetical protein
MVKAGRGDEKVCGMCAAGDFAAGEAVADCLGWLVMGWSEGMGGVRNLLDGLAGEGIGDLLAETRSVGLRHDR